MRSSLRGSVGALALAAAWLVNGCGTSGAGSLGNGVVAADPDAKDDADLRDNASPDALASESTSRDDSVDEAASSVGAGGSVVVAEPVHGDGDSRDDGPG